MAKGSVTVTVKLPGHETVEHTEEFTPAEFKRRRTLSGFLGLRVERSSRRVFQRLKGAWTPLDREGRNA